MFDVVRNPQARRALLGRLVGPDDRTEWVVLLQDEASCPIEFFVVAHGSDSAVARRTVEDGLLVAGYAHEPIAVPGAWTRAWRVTP
jgi:hypothetical protein